MTVIVPPEIEQSIPDRPFRERNRTSEITVHKIGPHGAKTCGEVEHFFLTDPEGVATVVLKGSYAEKRPVFESWRKNGYIPKRHLEAAYVPYHFLVEPPRGRIVQCLPLLAYGAHEPRSNGRAVAIAVVGDYDVVEPTDDVLISFRRLVKYLAFDQSVRRDTKQDVGLVRVVGHDTVRDHPKGCPGKHLLPEVTLMNDWLQGVQRQLRLTSAERF